ncbi:unnamed protein product, partial [Pylaiella littoralis]
STSPPSDARTTPNPVGEAAEEAATEAVAAAVEGGRGRRSSWTPRFGPSSSGGRSVTLRRAPIGVRVTIDRAGATTTRGVPTSTSSGRSSA